MGRWEEEMLYYRVTDERRDPGTAAREMISSRNAAMLVADKIYGDLVMAMFLPEKINHGSTAYYKLDPTTLTPKFGAWREMVERDENRLLRTEKLVWDDDEDSPLLSRARAHWNMWENASKVSDPAHVVRCLFSKVMYPESDVEAHFTGRTYLEVRAGLYRKDGINDTPMSLFYRKTGTEYRFKSPINGKVVEINPGWILLAGAEGRFYAKKPKGVEPLVEKGQDIAVGAPLWRLGEKYKNTVAGGLLTDMWHQRIFSMRGDDRYIHSQFVTRPKMVCQRCLRSVEGDECPNCKTNGMPVAAIPVVSRFWIAGGRGGMFCKSVSPDFPALPRLDDLEEVVRRRRIRQCAARNRMDKAESPVMVSA